MGVAGPASSGNGGVYGYQAPDTLFYVLKMVADVLIGDRAGRRPAPTLGGGVSDPALHYFCSTRFFRNASTSWNLPRLVSSTAIRDS